MKRGGADVIRSAAGANCGMLTFGDDELNSESAPAERDDYVVTGALLFVHEP
jgi:hypothetical protein